MIEPSILTAVNVPVFALTWATPRRVVAWNAGMVTMTGRAAGAVIGARPETALGPAAEVLQTAADGAALRLTGIGSVFARRQDDLLVCTVSDHEREVFIGLAAQDLRVPLRSIQILADEAVRGGLSSDAVLDRIKRIARQGMALTQDVVTCAQAGQGTGTPHRKVHLPALAGALLSVAAPDDRHRLAVSPVTVLVERAVLQSSLRVLIGHAIHTAGAEGARLQLRVIERAGLVEFALTDSAQPLAASVRDFVGSGAFSGEEGFGLLGVRRLLRARGGDIGVRKAGAGTDGAIVMRMPGCILPAAKDRNIA